MIDLWRNFKATTLALLKVKINATAPVMYVDEIIYCNCSWKKSSAPGRLYMNSETLYCWQGHGAIAAHCGWRRRVRRGTDHAGSAAVATLEFYGTEFGVLDDRFRSLNLIYKKNLLFEGANFRFRVRFGVCRWFSEVLWSPKLLKIHTMKPYTLPLGKVQGVFLGIAGRVTFKS